MLGLIFAFFICLRYTTFTSYFLLLLRTNLRKVNSMENSQEHTTQPQETTPHADRKSYAMTVVVGVFVFFLGALLLLAARGTNLQNQMQTKTQTPIQSGQTVSQMVPASSQAVEGAMTEAGLKLTVTSPKDKSIVRSPLLTVTGKTAPNADVTVNDKDLVANRIGYFATMVTLDEGENTVDIIAIDGDGNYAEKELTVTYEPTE